MKRTHEPPSPVLVTKKAKTVAVDGKLSQIDDGWTRVEKRKGKKANKQENRPKFLYYNTEILKRHRAVGIDEIRDLVLHILSDASPPTSWLKITNPSQLSKVVVLLVPGITRELLGLPPVPTSSTENPNLPVPIPLATPGLPISFLSRTFSHACPTRAPGDNTRMHSVFGTFFSSPMTEKEKARQMEVKAKQRKKQGDPMAYALSLEEMLQNEYPIPTYMADMGQQLDDGWVETPREDEIMENSEPPRRQIYAIDCEMCMTESGKELARISIVDFYSSIRIYDSLCKPSNPVIDYLTKWSGITESHLANVTTTLPDVQSHLLRLLSAKPTPILLGHSLESDLKALKLAHPFCIDTALIFSHPRGRPLKPGLAWLTKKWCGREIQREVGGHDPEEDSRACVELFQKKLQYGAEFGEFKIEFESIFDRLSRSKNGIRCAVVDHGSPSPMHGQKATTSVGCASDNEVCEKVLDVLPSHDFVFGRFLDVAGARGWITPKEKDSSKEVPAVSSGTEPVSEERLLELVKELNEHLKTIHAALPSNTALILFTGHSDPRAMTALNSRKNAFESAIRSGKTTAELNLEERWMTEDVRKLEDEVERCKRGLVFLGVKG